MAAAAAQETGLPPNVVPCDPGGQFIEEEGLIENAATMGERLLTAARAMQDRHAVIGDVRGKGLIVGVELVTDQETREPAHDLRDAVIDEAFEKGLLLLGCGPNAVRFVPAMTVDAETVDEAMALFEEALTEAKESA